MTHDPLQHFLDAQESVYSTVVQELRSGKKRSHWMWFIFPQLARLGSSPTAKRFALHSLAEAQLYVAHAILGKRLRDCARLVCEVQNRNVSEIFGYPDDLKFHSSMTLFALAAPAEPLFMSALMKFFGGQRDAKTVAILVQRK